MKWMFVVALAVGGGLVLTAVVLVVRVLVRYVWGRF
jgi:hypothetical protein